MVAEASPAQRSAAASPLALAPSWMLVGAGLLLCSATALAGASLQRWVVAQDSWSRTDRLVEDHAFDYSYPADPWENLGTAAQVFGVGYLLLALAVVVVSYRAIRLPPRRTRVLGGVAAASFALDGGHALVSGIVGSPSPVQQVTAVQLLLSLAAAISLFALVCVWLRRSWALALTWFLIIGATVPGYLVVAFNIAPIVAGYQSYDSTPWTETVVAAVIAAAAIALLIAAALATAHNRRVRAATLVRS